VITAVRQAGIEQILVVVGPRTPDLVALAEAAGASALLLEEQTADMRATVIEGLRCLEAQFQPGDTDGWLVVPADHPELSPGVIERLLEAHRGGRPDAIVVPTFEGKRGHPILLGWEHARQIRDLPLHQGLNTYVRQQGDMTLEVPVDSVDILKDMDTPADYEQLRRARRQ
jgi:molybdenum cofactor cytidylyltransferase